MLSAVRRARARRGAGALDPLALQIGGNLAAVEVAGAGIAHRDARSTDRRVGGQEADPLVVALTTRAPLDARLHERAAPGVEREPARRSSSSALGVSTSR